MKSLFHSVYKSWIMFRIALMDEAIVKLRKDLRACNASRVVYYNLIGSNRNYESRFEEACRNQETVHENLGKLISKRDSLATMIGYPLIRIRGW